MEEDSFIRDNRQLRRNSTSAEDGWVGSMVEVARACNKLFTKHTCGVCHMYVDKQLEYETRQEDKSGGSHSQSPVERVWMKTGLERGNMEVDLYRQFLFDEDSVSQRGDGDDDFHGSRRARGGSNSRSPKELDEEQSIITHGTQ
jgi:hypothetical protein